MMRNTVLGSRFTLALAASMSLHAHADDALALYARGDCGGAVRAAAAAAAATNAARGDDLEALAQFSRIALDCRLPDSTGLDAALARELAGREQRDGADAAATVQVKLRMARQLAQRNRVDEALAITRGLHEQPQFARWPAPLRARVLGELASIDNERADAKPALDHATAAIALLRPDRDADPGVLIAALQDSGLALTRMRQGAKALPALDEAVTIARERFGENRREYAEALRFLGYALRDSGDFGKAIDAMEKALAIQQAQAEVDIRAVAVLQLNLAQTLKISGDGEHALERYEQALASDAVAADPGGRTRPAILHGMANLYRGRGDNARALVLYAQAVPLFASVFGERSVQLAQVLNNYGNAQANVGDYDKAIALYERALDIARERHSVDPGDYAPQANIAMLRIWQARYAEAEPAFREILERLRGVSVGSEGNILFAELGLAASLWGQGRLDEAFAAAVHAEQSRQAGLRLAIGHLGEAQAIDLQEYQRPTLDFVLAIAAAGGKPVQLQRAWELSMSARDQVTEQLARRLAAARSTQDTVLAPLWRARREASGALARAELETAVDSAGRREAKEALARAERALAGASPLAAAAAERAARPLADIRAKLPAATALVLFASVQPRVASDFAKPEAEKNPQLYAFVLAQGDAPVRAIRLGSLTQATTRIDAWAAVLGDRGSALADLARRGRAVRQQLFDPLAPMLSGKRVLVIPVGALFRLPWAALPDRDGFLIDARWTFHALNHEGELLTAAARDSGRLVAIADPSPLPASVAGCASGGLAALPGARREAERIGTIWRDHFGRRDAAAILLGTDASESRVRRESSGAAVLHFATHSIGAGNGCALGATRSLSLVGDAADGDGDAAPLPPSALALASGDAARNDDDGLLGTEEIATLDLSQVDWAVLAACATATGSTRHYEGLFGLSRAFRLAGARTVIMSLWPVDDGATAQWVEALYGARLDRGLDTAAAMQAAQRQVLADRRRRGEPVHPYYWAAFVAAGDWR
jgi:CHAT domain-containing protein/Tfp pilus assembly protein PilF